MASLLSLQSGESLNTGIKLEREEKRNKRKAVRTRHPRALPPLATQGAQQWKAPLLSSVGSPEKLVSLRPRKGQLPAESSVYV